MTILQLRRTPASGIAIVLLLGVKGDEALNSGHGLTMLDTSYQIEIKISGRVYLVSHIAATPAHL